MVFRPYVIIDDIDSIAGKTGITAVQFTEAGSVKWSYRLLELLALIIHYYHLREEHVTTLLDYLSYVLTPQHRSHIYLRYGNLY